MKSPKHDWNVRPKKTHWATGNHSVHWSLAMAGSELTCRNFNLAVMWRIVWKHYNVPVKDNNALTQQCQGDYRAEGTDIWIGNWWLRFSREQWSSYVALKRFKH